MFPADLLINFKLKDVIDFWLAVLAQFLTNVDQAFIKARSLPVIVNYF